MSTKFYQQETTINPVNTIGQHDSRSKLYRFQSSQAIKNRLESAGFTLQGTSFAQCRNLSKMGFQKHVMSFTRPDLKIDDDNFLQILVTNSHDGSTPVILNMGIYRLVCANGLVVGDTITEHKIRHQGAFFQEKLESTLNEMMYIAPEYTRKIKAMQTVELTLAQKLTLAQDIANERLGQNYAFTNVQKMIEPLRKGDNANDLWTVTNILQEKAIRGGIEYTTSRNTKQGTVLSLTKSRQIKNVQTKIELNKNIWNLAERMVA